ncbi:30S ribosomal protein S17 [candidate division WWE3 bacterium]|nr:30S ribosomal protein S17 [candidate division WWE3 bacterium]
MNEKGFVGKVVSDRMVKTAIVAVEMPRTHPVYGKKVKNTRRFKARNDVGAKMGNLVVISQCRPLGKGVSWKIAGIVE